MKVEQIGRGQGLEVFFGADDRVIIGGDPAQIGAQEVRSAGGGIVLPPLAVFLQHHAFLVLQLVRIGVEAVHQDGVEDEEGLQMLGAEPRVVRGHIGRGRGVAIGTDAVERRVVLAGREAFAVQRWRAAKHHVFEHVGDAVGSGLFIQRPDLVSDAGVNRWRAMVFDDDHVHAVVEGDPARLLVQRPGRQGDQRRQRTGDSEQQFVHCGLRVVVANRAEVPAFCPLNGALSRDDDRFTHHRHASWQRCDPLQSGLGCGVG